MNKSYPLLSLALAAAVGASALSAPNGADDGTAPADLTDPRMIVVSPDEIEWSDGPPSIPAGAEVAMIEGDPSAEGEIFVFRIRLPAGYTLPPHVHPADERVTVISGTLNLGMGERIDRDDSRALPAGSQFMMPPGHAHYVWTGEEEAVIQLTSVGPWDIRYIRPEDDPRRNR